jgi:hypothetical protein
MQSCSSYLMASTQLALIWSSWPSGCLSNDLRFTRIDFNLKSRKLGNIRDSDMLRVTAGGAAIGNTHIIFDS